MRVVSVLQKLDGAIVIAMRMTDDDVFDIGRVETQFLHAIHDFVLCGVTEQGVDQNDAGGSLHRPGAVGLCGQHIEVVKNLPAFGIPVLARRGDATSSGTRRRPARPPAASASGRTAARWVGGRLREDGSRAGKVRIIRRAHPDVLFRPIFMETLGDRDKLTSLRTLGRTSDFFTREIDQMLLKGECRIAIHSAKDLPDPLTQGISIVAITKGVDSSDVLVLRQGETFPKAGMVATSSARREECVRQLFPEAQFVDIRGNIQERLDKLTESTIDGVVIAEAALIRLQLTHLNRIRLPGETAHLQGRLAVTARAGDLEMARLFLSIQ